MTAGSSVTPPASSPATPGSSLTARGSSLTAVGAGSHPARLRDDHAQIAEESFALAFTGAPESAAWLGEENVAPLLDATPDGNVAPEAAREAVSRVLDGFPDLRGHLDNVARDHAAELYDAHQRVRGAARLRGVTYSVEPQLPVDLLGVYVLLPMPSA